MRASASVIAAATGSQTGSLGADNLAFWSENENEKPEREKKTVSVSFKGYFFLFLSCRIKHENIVALEDIYESSNHLYLIMQL